MHSFRIHSGVFTNFSFFVHEEDILKRTNAIWSSPDGKKLVYATFNDTEVQQVRWKVYEDTSEGNLDPYPKEKHMHYPKVMYFFIIRKKLYDSFILISSKQLGFK